MQLGLVLFLVGAGLASVSTEMWQLIACRAVMGAAGALIMPSTLSIIINIFPPHERPKAIAIWASVTGAAGALRTGRQRIPARPLLVRLGVPRQRPDHRPRARRRDGSSSRSRATRSRRSFDPVGAVLSIIGIVALVYGLIEAPDKGWSSAATLGAFAVAIVVLAMFVAWELHVDEPMLDMHYFRNPAFSTGTGGMILVFVAMYGVMFLITQYFQLVLGYSALSAALRLMPIALIMLVVAPLTPRLSAQFGAHRTVAFGMLLHRDSGSLLFSGLTHAHAVRVRRRVRDPPHHRDRDDDVADDRVDHDGRPGSTGRRRLRDERRHSRARRRARHRGARQRRGVALRRQDRATCSRASARRTARPRDRRSPARSTSPINCPARPAPCS